jgi:lipopolysaccharide biosynthesis protein
MQKRLFIFAGFDKDCIVDDTVVYYLRALAELGDVIFWADCNIPAKELDKVRAIGPSILHAEACRHEEYDFGSYKRGYQWAKDNDILKNYEWVYLVNDSVYGPVFPLAPLIDRMESSGADANGMAMQTESFIWKRRYKSPRLVETWFIGLSPEIFLSAWFDEFIGKHIAHQDKAFYVYMCEIKLSQLIEEHGYKLDSLFTREEKNNSFRNPIFNLGNGCPFIKKHQHALSNIPSRGILFYYVPETLRKLILQHMSRHNTTFGLYFDSWRIGFGKIPLLALKSIHDPYFNLLYRDLPQFKLVLFGFITLFRKRGKWNYSKS